MLTELQLAHFKAFRAPVRIPLRALTLFFGGNSAGKSSVFHAMHLAREVLTKGNLDPDRTELGGATLDLGGFANLAHAHDLTRPVVLGFVLAGESIAWDAPPEVLDALAQLGDESGEGRPLLGDGSTREVRVSLELSAGSARERVYVSAIELALGAGSGPAVRVERSSATQLGATITCFDVAQWRRVPEQPDLEYALAMMALDELRPDGPMRRPQCDLAVDGVSERWGLVGGFEDWKLWTGAPEEIPDGVALLQTLVPWALDAAFDELRSELKKLLHVGPIRVLPDRRFRAPMSPSPGRWYAGLAAWDELLGAHESFVQLVNEWLSDEGIDARVRLEVREVLELEPERLREAIAKARDEDFTALEELQKHAQLRRHFVASDEERKVLVAPRDLGVGMSQVIPVVVAALQLNKRLIAVEQPELHVHPRVAVGLGDLFASQVHKSKQLLVETHSEHLLLRVLRRIRETGQRLAAGVTEVPEGAVELLPEQVSVVYFDARDGEVTVHPLRVDRAGHFLDRWPHGFFEEQLAELVGQSDWSLSDEPAPEE